MSHIKKALYIKKNVDEKRSCVMLERCTRQLPFPISFMVTTNCFFALECAEHNYFDIIIGENDFTDFNFQDMKKVLRTVGNRTPFVLLESREDSMPEIHREFYDVLEEPFSASDLCNLIEKVVDCPNVNAAPSNRVAQVSVSSSAIVADNTTHTTASSGFPTTSDGGIFKRRNRPPNGPNLDVIDEELPTTFDTQITFGLEGAYSVLPPTVEEAIVEEEVPEEGMEAIGALSRLSGRHTGSVLPSDTTSHIVGAGGTSHSLHSVFRNDSASVISARINTHRNPVGKLDAIQGLFAGAAPASSRGLADCARIDSLPSQPYQSTRIHNLLEKMGTDLLHCKPPPTAVLGTAADSQSGGRQIQVDLNAEQKTRQHQLSQQHAPSNKKRSIDNSH